MILIFFHGGLHVFKTVLGYCRKNNHCVT